jgi:hypothetical protein
MHEIGYIKAFGISYIGTLPKIKKATDQLQPIYEAFTNSLESIRLLKDNKSRSKISLNICFKKNMFSTLEFDSIQIEDSGLGFTDKEFERLLNLNDTGKGFSNKGSGRVQYIHFFEKVECESIFRDDNSKTGFKKRKFTLSKSEAFLKSNAIVRHDSLDDIEAKNPITSVRFNAPLNKNDLDYFESLSISDLKESLINRYLANFCENKDSLPEIVINKVVNEIIEEKLIIEKQDIPAVDKELDIFINYSRISNDRKTIEKSAKTEKLNLKGFKISKDKLQKNGIKLTSKGEIAKDIKLETLLVDDYIDGNRYLFLVSGDYINSKDTDTRGTLNIPTLEEFKKSMSPASDLFAQEEILIDEIKDVANDTILKMYDEIRERTKQKDIEVEKLQRMFLLNPITIKEAKIKLNDTDEEILEKIYKVDAKVIAKKDAEIKKRVDSLDSLNPNEKNFQEKFTEEVTELTKAIPLQNRTELTHYVARRKLVLDLLDKILKRKLTVQNGNKSKLDEALIHNLLFQKGSDKPENSDLWIINEDFIYFSGSSEKRLNKLEIDGKKVFKNSFSEEEEKHLMSLGENRKIKRPDVLLFPSEGKCIILEFKAPEANVSDHLVQINKYASLIRNYTNDEFQLTTFYGYLIGESIEARDVLGAVGNFEHSYHLDYFFKPSEKVYGFDKSDGSIYTEVIKYSTLLERARKRNDIFINKL